VIEVLGMVSERPQVLAAQHAPEPEPRFVGNRDHDVLTAHPSKLRERRVGIVEVLEHLETEDEVEGAVVVGQVVDARGADLDRGKPPSRALDRLGADVHCGHPRGQRREPEEGLALAAAGIEQRGGAERLDDRSQASEEAIDQQPDDGVAGLELGVVAALGHGRSPGSLPTPAP
jgi:hypothetical protein